VLLVKTLKQLLEHVAVATSGQRDFFACCRIPQACLDATAKTVGLQELRIGHAEPDDGVALVVVIFPDVNPEALEQIPVAAEEFSYGVKQESLAESPWTGQETAPVICDQLLNVLGLVGVKIVPVDD
jgi:hypothetical protein